MIITAIQKSCFFLQRITLKITTFQKRTLGRDFFVDIFTNQCNVKAFFQLFGVFLVHEKMYHVKWSVPSEVAVSSSFQVASFSLGLFLKLPSLFSSESILSQSLNETILTFLSCKRLRRPSLPGFGAAVDEIKPPFSSSSNMLETYHVNCQRKIQ